MIIIQFKNILRSFDWRNIFRMFRAVKMVRGKKFLCRKKCPENLPKEVKKISVDFFCDSVEMCIFVFYKNRRLIYDFVLAAIKFWSGPFRIRSVRRERASIKKSFFYLFFLYKKIRKIYTKFRQN